MEPIREPVRHVVVQADPTIDFLAEAGRRELVSMDDLERLFVEQRSKMVRLAALLTGSVATAEEVVQEAFIKLFEKRSTIDNPVAYLHRTVVNGSHSRTRRRSVETSKLARLRSRPENDSGGTAVEDAEVWEHLDVLSARQRTAIVLRFYNDLSTAATAEAMGVRPGTVKSLVHRGLEQLRKEIPND